MVIFLSCVCLCVCVFICLLNASLNKIFPSLLLAIFTKCGNINSVSVQASLNVCILAIRNSKYFDAKTFKKDNYVGVGVQEVLYRYNTRRRIISCVFLPQLTLSITTRLTQYIGFVNVIYYHSTNQKLIAIIVIDNN